MAGHSKFANIKHRKAAQDKKRGKVFTKIIKEITIAARGNPDEASNPSLRTAIIAAKAVNMPKDNIDKAVKKGNATQDGENYEAIRYEAYGNGGTAFIIETLTDNKNRSASTIRSSFTKHGGNLAEQGSVSFMFDHCGVIRYPASVASEDEIFEMAVESGAEAVESEDDLHIVTTAVADFASVRDALMEKYGDPEGLGLEWLPKDIIEVPEDKKETLLKMIEILEDDDDVQNIYTNADLIF